MSIFYFNVVKRVLYDIRDNSAYTIRKLADGNCWLTENLRLDISDSSVQAKLTSTTTNATDTVLSYLKNGGGTSPYPANGVVAKTASGGSWADDFTNPYIATGYKDAIQPASGSAPAGRIGIYYNYCAASAGSYCYSYNVGSGDANYDICPKGWRLPTTGASGEYQALYTTAYNSNITNFMTALDTPLSGLFEIGSGYSGTNGFFWSSTFATTAYMKGLYITGTSVNPQFASTGYGSRGFGFSIRCIAR